MSATDYVVFEPDSLGVWEFAETWGAALSRAFTLAGEKGKPFRADSWENWSGRKIAGYLESGPLAEITQERFDYLLGVLPPIYRAGALGYFLSEFDYDSVTTQFCEYGGRYFAKTINMRDRSTWITPTAINESLSEGVKS